jgi:hypothetical protein
MRVRCPAQPAVRPSGWRFIVPTGNAVELCQSDDCFLGHLVEYGEDSLNCLHLVRDLHRNCQGLRKPKHLGDADSTARARRRSPA